MKHAWKKSSQLTSALAVVCLLGWPQATGAQGKAAQTSIRRANELTLARLRPGVHTLEVADRLYKPEHRTESVRGESEAVWHSPCHAKMLSLEVDERGLIQSLSVSSTPDRSRLAGCAAEGDPMKTRDWKTGRGLALGDSKARVMALYGQPDSRVPSTQGGRELELLFYAFDWVGPDVPQVMEVSLAGGRVVQITLAFPSL